MQTAPAAYGVIVEGNEVARAVRVTIDWPAAVPAAYQSMSDLTVKSCSPSQDTTTDMPAGTVYSTGQSKGMCDVTLAGTLDRTDESQTITDMLDPYNSASPMFRKSPLNLPVFVEEGVFTGDPTATDIDYEGVTFLPVGTYVIDDYTVDAVAGTVALSLIDARSDLFGPASIPSVNTVQSYYPVLTGEFPLDSVLRPQFLTWPAQRASCVLAAGMRASIWPEVGQPSIALPVVDPLPEIVRGKFGSALSNLSLFYELASPVGTSMFVEGWFYIDAAIAQRTITIGDTTNMDVVSPNFSVEFGWALDANDIYVVVNDPAPSSALVRWTGADLEPGFHYIGWHVVGTAVRMCVDGEVRNYTLDKPPSGSMPYALVYSDESVEGLQITTETGTPDFNAGFQPNAAYDPSLNTLVAIPDTSGMDQWAVAQLIVEAEQGVVGLDELGFMRFRNRNTIRTGPVVRTITRAQSLVALQVEQSQAAVINHVQVPVNKLQIGPPTAVWSAPDLITVPARGVFTQQITTDNPVVNLTASDSGEMPAGGGTPGLTYWRACTSPDGGGTRVTTGITVTLGRVSSTQITMTVRNSNGFPVYLVTPIGVGFPTASNGQPTLAIGGQFILSQATASDGTILTSSGVTVDVSAGVTATSDFMLPVSANPWIQRVDVATQLANDLLSDLRRFRPIFTGLKIVADRRLQKADRVSLEVSDGVFADAIIRSIASDDDGTMTIDARAVHTPGGWVLGRAGRSQLGVSTWI